MNHVRQKYWVTQGLRPKKKQVLEGFQNILKVKSKLVVPTAKVGSVEKETGNEFL